MSGKSACVNYTTTSMYSEYYVLSAGNKQAIEIYGKISVSNKITQVV